jgi:hypothetical protein
VADIGYYLFYYWNELVEVCGDSDEMWLLCSDDLELLLIYLLDLLKIVEYAKTLSED